MDINPARTTGGITSAADEATSFLLLNQLKIIAGDVPVTQVYAVKPGTESYAPSQASS